MRISPTPVEIRNKFISKPQQTLILMENSRSSSLSNSALHSSKFVSRVETPYSSPYYNSNSGVFVGSQQYMTYELNGLGKAVGNSQNTHVMQKTIKNLSERVQIIEKKLKAQENPLRINSKMSGQKQLIELINEKIAHQLQKKADSQNELLFQQIRRLEHQISQKIQNQPNNEYELLGGTSFLQLGKQKSTEQESINSQKRGLKLMEEKIREEVFRMQIKLQNSMNKALKTLKNSGELKTLGEIGNSKEHISLSSVFSKSTLKYKYRPVYITVKNEVRVHQQDPPKIKTHQQDPSKIKTHQQDPTKIKNHQQDPLKIKTHQQDPHDPLKIKKDTLSASNSTGSSEQNQQKHQKILDFEQFTYFIDREGYLLDQEGFYLLDEKDKMVRIDTRLHKRLREFGMIE